MGPRLPERRTAARATAPPGRTRRALGRPGVRTSTCTGGRASPARPCTPLTPKRRRPRQPASAHTQGRLHLRAAGL